MHTRNSALRGISNMWRGLVALFTFIAWKSLMTLFTLMFILFGFAGEAGAGAAPASGVEPPPNPVEVPEGPAPADNEAAYTQGQASGFPLFCETTRTCLQAKDFFANLAVQYGIEWTGGVQGSMDYFIDANIPDPGTVKPAKGSAKKGAEVRASMKSEEAGLGRLPTGAANQLAYGGKYAFDRTGFDQYLGDHDCEQTGYDEEMEMKIFSPGCNTLAEAIGPFIGTQIDKSRDETRKANAEYLYGKALTMEGDQRVAMLHYAWLMLMPSDWGVVNDLTPNNYDQAKAALDAGKTEFHGNYLPPVVNEELAKQWAEQGLDGCLYVKGSKEDPHCGPIENVDDAGFTVGDREVKYDEIPSQKIVTIGKLGPQQTDYERAKAAKEAGEAGVDGHTFVPDSLDKDKAKALAGLEGNLYRDGQLIHRGEIDDIGDDGFTVGGELVSYDDLNSGKVFVTIGDPMSDGNGGVINNAGLQLYVGFTYNAVLSRGGNNQNPAHYVGGDLGIGYQVPNFPFYANVGVMFMGRAKGGVEGHYDFLNSRFLAVFYAEAGVPIRLHNRIGLKVGVQGGATHTGGWMLRVNSRLQFIFNPLNVYLAFGAGYMDTNQVAGGNLTSHLPDNPIQGPNLSASAGVELKPGAWLKKNRKAKKAKAQGSVSTSP